MIKSILGALALIASSVVGNASTLEEVSKSTYKLYQSGRAICSTVAISPTQLLTAAHCVEEDASRRDLAIANIKKINDEIVSVQQYNAKAIRVNYDDDTALIELTDPDFKMTDYVDIAEEYSPSLGDEMFAVGYPRVAELTITSGMFTELVTLKEFGIDGHFYKTTVPVTGGSSGGGIYSKYFNGVTLDGVKQYEYELVGLTTAGWRDVSFQTYFSTLEAVQKVMKGLRKD